MNEKTLNQTQEQIYKRIISELENEVKRLLEENNALRERIQYQEIDFQATFEELNELTRQAREHVREAQELKQQVMLEKARYQALIEQAIENIASFD